MQSFRCFCNTCREDKITLTAGNTSLDCVLKIYRVNCNWATLSIPEKVYSCKKFVTADRSSIYLEHGYSSYYSKETKNNQGPFSFGKSVLLFNLSWLWRRTASRITYSPRLSNPRVVSCPIRPLKYMFPIKVQNSAMRPPQKEKIMAEKYPPPPCTNLGPCISPPLSFRFRPQPLCTEAGALHSVLYRVCVY